MTTRETDGALVWRVSRLRRSRARPLDPLTKPEEKERLLAVLLKSV